MSRPFHPSAIRIRVIAPDHLGWTAMVYRGSRHLTTQRGASKARAVQVARWWARIALRVPRMHPGALAYLHARAGESAAARRAS